MLHVTSDVIGMLARSPLLVMDSWLAQYHFLKSKMAAMYFALYQNLKLFLVNLFCKTLETELKRF